jgi:Fungal protein kinase
MAAAPMAPTEQGFDFLPRKRVKNSSEQSRTIAQAGVPDDLDLQCASYALELLSHGGLRNHVIAVAVTDRKIKLLYYDRSIIVTSSPIDFIDDDLYFILMLKGFATLTPLQWGYEPLVQSPHLPPRPPPLEAGETVSLGVLKGQMIVLSNGKVLELGKTVYHHHGLIGRGTWVLRAKLKKGSESTDGNDAWNRGLIVKLSWSPKSRKSEDIIINEAHSQAKACGDLWVLDHLPNVMHAQDIDRTTEDPVSGLIELLGDSYEPRVLRLLVLEELVPISELAAPSVLADAFRDIFNCEH